MLPEAPGRLSTMTGCPSAWVSLSATARARMSVDPPGAHGTMMWTGRSGHAAPAAVAKTRKSEARMRWKVFMGLPGEVSLSSDRVALHAAGIRAGLEDPAAVAVALARAGREPAFGPGLSHDHVVAPRPQGL